MKHLNLIVICFLIVIQYGFSRERISLNEEWRFKKDDPVGIGNSLDYFNIKQWVLPTGNKFLINGKMNLRPEGNLSGGVYSQSDFNDSEWRTLNLPHDWGIEGPFNQDYPGETAKLPWWGVAWYRKHLVIDKKDEGQQFYLDIDGSMSFTSVWCNGQFAGGWAYGYASFRVDLTPYIKAGQKNVIAIRLDNMDESSRWYPGGGIYRNVWLVNANPVSVSQWGTFVTTSDVSEKAATVNLKVNVDNCKLSKIPVQLRTDIYVQGIDGKPQGKALTSNIVEAKVLQREDVFNQTFTLSDPKLWDITSPNMYVAVTSLIQNKKTVDTYNTSFGVRTLEFKVNDGFHLNGRRVPMQGVCMHHDLGALGSAFNYRAMERQIEILKEMGVNAIRTSHNPPAPEMLDLCDKMGILVLDEFVDTWLIAKKKNGYALIFNDWHEQDLRAFVRRDRNHPSVIMWSTGNEVSEQYTKEGTEVSKKLTAIVHEEDPSRSVTIGYSNPKSEFHGFEYSVDVLGFNYKPHFYAKFKNERSAIPFYGSETSSCISSRGEYLFPVDEKKSGGKIGFQMSSYDLYAPGWATTPDVEFKGQDEVPASGGEFVWTGFDYLGEPTPYTSDMSVLTNFQDPAELAKAEKELKEMGKIKVPSRSSYFGIVDLAGFKKDRFYIYQARWRSDLPMAHILPHWNWDERVGQITPIHVYTSGDSAELFLNGKSLGKKTKGKYEYRLRWDDVVYEPGEVKVIAYKNGQKWAEDIVKTTDKPAQLKLEANRPQMKADGQDLIYVTVKINDKNSLTVPRSKNLVKFEVSGPAEIVATDNGDPTSHESFQNKHVKAFNGLCLVILRSVKGKSGNIQLKAVSEGLTGSTVNLKSLNL